MEKAKKVVEFYVACNKLKDILRTGWQDWNVKRERIESIAEHVFGVQMLAISMWSEYKYDVDIQKVLSMLAVHELEEVILGDLTLFDIDEKTKKEKGHQAVEKLTKILYSGQTIKDLIFEFDVQKTTEAKFAYFCDKLECDIQCKLYDEEGCVDLKSEENQKLSKIPSVKNALETEKTWSGAWLYFSKERYGYDKNFLEVSDYVKANNIEEINTK